MAIERIPSVDNISAFISAPIDQAYHLKHLQPIMSISDMVKIVGNPALTKFYFKFTYDAQAHGLEWYEVDLLTARVPSNEQCLELLQQYINAHPGFRFTDQWFDADYQWPIITELPEPWATSEQSL
jgi:hypothetical protein